MDGINSINTQINRIKQNIANTYDILETKEVEVPTIQNSDALDEVAQAIYHNLHCINLHSPETIELNFDEYHIIDIEQLKATGEIVNQNITVTENGTYTVDELYTGIGTVVVDTPYKAILDEIKLTLSANNIEPPTNYADLPAVIALAMQTPTN